MDDLDALPPKLHEALAAYGQRAGLMLQRDSARVYLDLADEARDQGVIWTDMDTAVREHPDLVQQYFMDEAVPATADKYTALHAAFWSGGTLLYVPENVTVELPFVSVLWQEMPSLAVFPPYLLIAEEGQQCDPGLGTALDGLCRLPRHLPWRRHRAVRWSGRPGQVCQCPGFWPPGIRSAHPDGPAGP